MSTAPICPPAAPIADVTRPSWPSTRSISTLRVSENCALGEAMEEERAWRTGHPAGAGDHINPLLARGSVPCPLRTAHPTLESAGALRSSQRAVPDRRQQPRLSRLLRAA